MTERELTVTNCYSEPSKSLFGASSRAAGFAPGPILRGSIGLGPSGLEMAASLAKRIDVETGLCTDQ